MPAHHHDSGGNDVQVATPAATHVRQRASMRARGRRTRVCAGTCIRSLPDSPLERTVRRSVPLLLAGAGDATGAGPGRAFGPTRRRPAADVCAVVYWAPGPLPGGRTPPACEARLLPLPAGPGTRSAMTGARLADPGQPGHGVAPSYAERPCGGRRGN